MADPTSKPELDPLSTTVDPAHTALIVIDMQNDFCSTQGKAATAGVDVSMMQEIIPRIADLLRVARRLKVPVVHLQVLQAADGHTLSKAHLRLLRSVSPAAPFGIAGTWGGEFVDELKPEPREPVVVKHRSGGFSNTTLNTVLRSLEIETVVIVGEQTPGCVEATVRGADDNDYLPVLVTDCVGGLRRDLHDAALKVMCARWPSATSREIIAAWESAAPPVLAR